MQIYLLSLFNGLEKAGALLISEFGEHPDVNVELCIRVGTRYSCMFSGVCEYLRFSGILYSTILSASSRFTTLCIPRFCPHVHYTDDL